MTHRIVVNEPTTNGQRHIGVVFEDGTPSGVRMDYSVSTVDELKARIRADSDTLDQSSDLAKVPVDASLDTAIVIIPPTQDQIDRADYFKQVVVLTQLRQVFTAGDKALTDQETLVKTLYKPEYYQ